RPHRPRVRLLASAHEFRLPPEVVAEAAAADRAAGRRPFCVVATSGTTSTGSVDPLADLAALCRAEGLWFHVDGAFGAPAILTAEGRRLLAGIEQADSLALDAHKWLFQPLEAGCVLVRDVALLSRSSRPAASSCSTPPPVTARSTSPTAASSSPAASARSSCGC